MIYRSEIVDKKGNTYKVRINNNISEFLPVMAISSNSDIEIGDIVIVVIFVSYIDGVILGKVVNE